MYGLHGLAFTVLQDMRNGTHEATGFADALARYKSLRNIMTASGQVRRGQPIQSARK